MNISCTLHCADGTSYTLTDCLRFTLLRDRYQPYAQLYAQFFTETPAAVPCEAEFSLEGRMLHDGSVAKAECVRASGRYLLKFSSRSFTAALTKNQLVPGLHFHVTLRTLMETYALPKITYDTAMPEISYIYVRENTAMWESLTAYNYKLNGSFPYIRVPNLLCMTPQSGSEPVQLPADAVYTEGSGGDSSEMLSRIDMANAAGEYGSFTMTNPEAESRSIVRVRQIQFDKQYAHAPEDVLRWRIALSNRRLRSRMVCYSGYCGEDLEDPVQLGTLCAHVSRIHITGDRKGIRTEDTFYFDPFCNPPQ